MEVPIWGKEADLKGQKRFLVKPTRGKEGNRIDKTWRQQEIKRVK